MRSRPGWSSPASKTRPRAGPRPSTENRLAETVLPTRRTASPCPVRFSSVIRAHARDLHGAAQLLQGHHRALRVEARQPDEPLGRGIRKGPEEDGVHEAEHRRVAADAERERQHGHRREAGALPEHAGREPRVLPERLEAYESPHVAALLLQGDGVPEPAHGRAPGFVGAQARVPVLLFAHGEMEAQLVVQVALELAGAGRAPSRAATSSGPAPRTTWLQAVSMIRAMPAVMRVQ